MFIESFDRNKLNGKFLEKNDSTNFYKLIIFNEKKLNKSYLYFVKTCKIRINCLKVFKVSREAKYETEL